MAENLFKWEKVSFSEYLNKDGRIIKTIGFALYGEVLMYQNIPVDPSDMRIASVSCVDGELYFVPFDSLVFLEND